MKYIVKFVIRAEHWHFWSQPRFAHAPKCCDSGFYLPMDDESTLQLQPDMLCSSSTTTKSCDSGFYLPTDCNQLCSSSTLLPAKKLWLRFLLAKGWRVQVYALQPAKQALQFFHTIIVWNFSAEAILIQPALYQIWTKLKESAPWGNWWGYTGVLWN